MTKTQVLTVLALAITLGFVINQYSTSFTSQDQAQVISQLSTMTSDISAESLIDVQVEGSPVSNGFWDTTTKYANQFIIDGGKATKKSAGQTKQVVSSRPITGKTTVTFRLFDYPSDSSGVLMGIITEDRRDAEFTGNVKDSVIFWTKPSIKSGITFNDGQGGAAWSNSLYVPPRGYVTMQVDIPGAMITFTNKDNNYKRVLRLPLKFKTKQVYVVCSVMNINNGIEAY